MSKEREQRAALRIARANNRFDELRESLPEGFHVGYIGNVGWVGNTFIDDRAWAIYREHGEERAYTDEDTIGRVSHEERYKLNKWINVIKFAHGVEAYINADS